MPNLTLIPGSLPNPSCYPSTPQELYNLMFSLGYAVQGTTLTGVIKQDAEPAITDRDKVWIRTSGGAPVFPLAWIFYNGQWVSRHPITAGSLWAYPYTGSLASIDTLDGGLAGAVSDNSGPFWEVATSMAARVPIGVGTLPSGTVLNVGDTGGEEKHQLLTSEMPSHTHKITSNGTSSPSNGNGVLGGGNDFTGPFTYDDTTLAASHFSIDKTGGDTAHNTLPPYRVIYFLQRTGRIYCTQPFS